MSLEGAQILAGWLADATYGVNAILTACAAAFPPEPAPPAVTVVSEADANWLVRDDIPQQVADAAPYLAIVCDGDTTLEPVLRAMQGGTPVMAEGEATYLLLYISKKTSESEAAVDAKHTLRAARGALWLLNNPPSGAAVRQSRGLELIRLKELAEVALTAQKGAALVTGALRVTYLIRETAPTVA